MPKTILLAEDSPDDEFFFKRVLKAAGVKNHLKVVRDGTQVVAYLKGEGTFADRCAHPIPVILFLDLRMPKMDGREVLEWLKTQTSLSTMLVVVLTAQNEGKTLQELYTLGAHSFLTKPFTVADMQTLIGHFDGYWIR